MLPSANKVYVAVKALFTPDAPLKPLSITWEDGTEYEIEEVLDVCRAASLKAGGAGIRYSIRIGKTMTYLFLEESNWFVERRARR